MEHHFALTDAEFEQQFLSCQLAAQDFTHLAHVRLAHLRIHRDGIEIAKRTIPVHLKAYCDAMGATDKFNLTLTIAAIKAVYHFVLKSEALDFKGFIAEYPQLINNFRSLINGHYGFDVINSLEAKTRF